MSRWQAKSGFGTPHAAAVAGKLAARGGEKPPAAELNVKLKQVREIAKGSDEKSKTEALEALRAELDEVGPTPTMEEFVQRQTVQRRGLLVVGAITIGGLGILVWQLYEYIRQRRREQLEDAMHDVFARTGDLPEQPTPAELTAGINANVAPAVKQSAAAPR